MMKDLHSCVRMKIVSGNFRVFLATTATVDEDTILQCSAQLAMLDSGLNAQLVVTLKEKQYSM